jgi:hypothetical protein
MFLALQLCFVAGAVAAVCPFNGIVEVQAIDRWPVTDVSRLGLSVGTNLSFVFNVSLHRDPPPPGLVVVAQVTPSLDRVVWLRDCEAVRSDAIASSMNVFHDVLRSRNADFTVQIRNSTARTTVSVTLTLVEPRQLHLGVPVCVARLRKHPAFVDADGSATPCDFDDTGYTENEKPLAALRRPTLLFMNRTIVKYDNDDVPIFARAVRVRAARSPATVLDALCNDTSAACSSVRDSVDFADSVGPLCQAHERNPLDCWAEAVEIGKSGGLTPLTVCQDGFRFGAHFAWAALAGRSPSDCANRCAAGGASCFGGVGAGAFQVSANLSVDAHCRRLFASAAQFDAVDLCAAGTFRFLATSAVAPLRVGDDAGLSRFFANFCRSAEPAALLCFLSLGDAAVRLADNSTAVALSLCRFISDADGANHCSLRVAERLTFAPAADSGACSTVGLSVFLDDGSGAFSTPFRVPWSGAWTQLDWPVDRNADGWWIAIEHSSLLAPVVIEVLGPEPEGPRTTGAPLATKAATAPLPPVSSSALIAIPIVAAALVILAIAIVAVRKCRQYRSAAAFRHLHEDDGVAQ